MQFVKAHMVNGFLRIVLIVGLGALTACSSMPPSTPPRVSAITNSDLPIGGQIGLPAGMTYQQAISELTSRSVLLLGTPYRLGGTSPAEGLDCSGLIVHVVQDAFRVRLPRTAEELGEVGARVTRQEIAPGDLVFFNTQRRPNSHVGVYLGEGRFVHAPTSRGVVRIETLHQRYWSDRFDQARRLIASQ
jgi:cell wall-associated NlpC family hydrolase